MSKWLLVLLIGGCVGTASGGSGSDWSVLRSPADDAKQRAILVSVGVVEPYAAEIRKSMTEAEAKNLLWQAFVAIHDERAYADGLEKLKRVLAFNPDFEASWWPDEKVETHAMAELSGVLYSLGDWEKARPAIELVDRMIHLSNPAADTFGTGAIEECRTRLASIGKTDFPPYVILKDTPTDDRSKIVDGVVIVPASQFAAYLGVSIARPNSSELTISVADGNGKRLTMTAESCEAQGNAGVVNLPTPPRQYGDDILIPVRAVAEYFGHTVTWKPVPKMAWVH